MVKIDLDRLCRRINYQFKKPALLKQALTHCSVGSENYERFEFLGDSILGFVIAHELFSQFPQYSEGELSRLRSSLVRGDMLVEIAKEISLGDFLYLGQGELKSGGFRRASILADSLEAIFAAVFLDGGIEAAKTVIINLYNTKLLDPNAHDSLKDAKTLLQECLQANKRSLPQYALVKVEGDEQDQTFYVHCTVEGIKYVAQGQGSTRRKAEQQAARLMLNELKSK